MLLTIATVLYLRRLGRKKAIRLLFIIFVLFNAVDVTRVYRNLASSSSSAAAATAARLEKKTAVHGGSSGEGEASRTPVGERVYIAAGLHLDDDDGDGGEQRRWRDWGSVVLELTERLGADKVFVSVSAATGGGDEALRDLDRQLESRGVAHRVVDNVGSRAEGEDEKEEGGDERERGGEDGLEMVGERRRRRRSVARLARLRNKTLRDLFFLHRRGVSFDKILFLGGVVFTVDDVVALLDTNDGAFAAACALDFSGSFRYRNSPALRDAEGSARLMSTWPYFRARASRSALVRNRDAVPVTSCWSGMVVMLTDPFISSTRLRFRAVPDALAEQQRLEGSERCLVHADNPLSRTLGVYVNPRVRVGYDVAAYEAAHASPPSSSWVSVPRILLGLWENRIRRWAGRVGASSDMWERRKVGSRVAAWREQDESHREPGDFCLEISRHEA